jgi:hypothetical protein
MNYKNEVLNYYPLAICWSINEGSIYEKFFIKTWVNSSKWLTLARRISSEELAWKKAWEQIQLNMISKFEGESDDEEFI